VGQHIVHLPGDPVAFGLADLGDPQFLFRLDPPRPFTHGLPPGPDEHPPGEHRCDAEDSQHDLPPGRHRDIRANQHGEKRDECIPGRDRADHREAPMHRDGEQRDERHARGRHRIDAEQAHDHREADRPAPAQPHPKTTQPAEGEVHGKRHRCHVLLKAVHQGKHREADGQQEKQDVDRPVARRASEQPPRARTGARAADRAGGERAPIPQARRGRHAKSVRPHPSLWHQTKVGPETQTFGPPVPTSDRSDASRRSGNMTHMTEQTALAEGTETKTSDVRGRISALWIVIVLNMIYADILSFLKPELLRELMTGYAEGIRVTQQLMMGAAVMGEIPILMVLLAQILKPAVNRWANFAAVPLTGAFIIGGGSTSPHYLFLATIELTCLALILRHAWRWR
jgi:hypothetical protein